MKVLLHLVRLYVWIYYHAITKLGIHLKGLGFVQRLITSDHVIVFRRKKLFYYHKVLGSYDCLLIGRANEPETHIFLDNVVSCNETQFSFIDVGASIGEFTTSISRHKNINEIYAFEPRPECVFALQRTAELNHESRIRIIGKAVGSVNGSINFDSKPSGSGSGIQQDDQASRTSLIVPLTRLDDELPSMMLNPILLIDVEGYEPEVLKGATSFIKNNHPLIIFEYNSISKKYFHYSDILSILGSNYTIYKLTKDGSLDKGIDNTWNCVAVPSNTLFEKICL